MIEETRAIAQTLQGVVSVRVSADHACGYFYTRKHTCNSHLYDNTPLLIGGSGTKQYLICLCQSSPLHFATEGAFTKKFTNFFLNLNFNFFFSPSVTSHPPWRVFAPPTLRTTALDEPEYILSAPLRCLHIIVSVFMLVFFPWHPNVPKHNIRQLPR